MFLTEVKTVSVQFLPFQNLKPLFQIGSLGRRVDHGYGEVDGMELPVLNFFQNFVNQKGGVALSLVRRSNHNPGKFCGVFLRFPLGGIIQLILRYNGDCSNDLFTQQKNKKVSCPKIFVDLQPAWIFLIPGTHW